MSLDYQVGPQYADTGSHSESGRIDGTGASVVTDAHGHFFEGVRLGLAGVGQGVWSAVTPSGGVAPGTVLNANPAFSIWNPPNSGMLVSILKTRFGYVSGTLGAGSIAYAYVSSQTARPTPGTTLTPSSQLIGSTATPRAQAFSLATVSATPTLLAPAYVVNAMLASTATNPVAATDLVDGEIVIVPGGVFCMHAIAAGGSAPLVFLGATWEEVPALT